MRTPIIEDYSIRTLTGSAVLSRLVLAGWGALNALETFTDRGRLWWKFTQGTALLELFRRPTMLSGDRVAYTSTPAASGKATLVQDTSSGLSGTCDLDDGTAGTNPAADARGDLIISYATENDLLDHIADAGGYLDTDDKFYAQGTRYEALLRKAKRELDELLVEKLHDDLGRDTQGRRVLAAIADPWQLAPVHALYCAYKLEAHRVGANEARAELAQWHLERARSMLRAMRIQLDDEADGAVDHERRTADRKLLRT